MLVVSSNPVRGYCRLRVYILLSFKHAVLGTCLSYTDCLGQQVSSWVSKYTNQVSKFPVKNQ